MERTRDNFQYRCLADFFELGEETPLAGILTFRRRAEAKFSWTFTPSNQLNAEGRFDTDDEDAPVIFELSYIIIHQSILPDSKSSFMIDDKLVGFVQVDKLSSSADHETDTLIRQPVSFSKRSEVRFQRINHQHK